MNSTQPSPRGSSPLLRLVSVGLAFAVTLGAVASSCTDADPVSSVNGGNAIDTTNWPADIPHVPDSIVNPSSRPGGTANVIFYVAGTCADRVSTQIDGDYYHTSAPPRVWVTLPVPTGVAHRVRIAGSRPAAPDVIRTTFVDTSLTLRRDTVMILRCP